MFADPQTVTVNAVAKVMARVSTSGLSSTYQLADESFKLTISHTIAKDSRIRTMARIDQRAIVTNPLDSTNDYDTLSFYVVVDRPSYGFTQAQMEQLITGFKTWLDATVQGKLYGQES